MKRKLEEENLSPVSLSPVSVKSELSDITQISIDELLLSVKVKKSTRPIRPCDEKKWQENYKMCSRVLEISGGTMPKTFRSADGQQLVDINWLYQWLCAQKNAWRTGDLHEDRIKLISSLFVKYPTLLKGTKIDYAKARFDTLEYYRQHKIFPQASPSNPEMTHMASWYNHIRTKFFNGELSNVEARSFAEFLIEIEKIRYSDWDEKYPKLLEYIQSKNRLPSPLERNLGAWIIRIYNRRAVCQPVLQENIERFRLLSDLVHKFSMKKQKYDRIRAKVRQFVPPPLEKVD